ncbi:RBR-type E3 ubiquitin transferase [Caerostris extrusa]|uniref:RBR-type E3 ubiquitin transferase n=1 Tax=Caerostris extrusa TaxID=172846 RepID=A0AAV4UPY5_CAEEX|nr:RBR-type E3 ubiquitin transferase [Caerostris extrusa]
MNLNPESTGQLSQKESISEEVHDSLVPLETEIPSLKSASVCEISDDNFEEPVILENPKPLSSEIPSKPSDIVRYLYYDDAITFEGDTSICDESFNSLDSANICPLPEPDIVSTENLPIDKSKLLQEPEILNTCQITQENLQMKHLQTQIESTSSEVDVSPSMPDANIDQQSIISNSEKDQFESIYSTSDSTEQWFDLEASKSFQLVSDEAQISQNSDQLTETKSTTKDGDLPCIPGFVSDSEAKGNFPTAVADSDEVTDISTHFTMTEDESDRFSDIESDSSFNNFDEEGLFSADRSQIEDLDLEIGEISFSENGNQVFIRQDDFLLDLNANKNEDNYIEECATPVEFDIQTQDVERSLTDVNGNLTEYIASSCKAK